MKNQDTISVNFSKDILTLLLNRPEKGNAINLAMVREVREQLALAEGDETIRFIIFSSHGNTFCSGADLSWMANAPALSEDENNTECMELAQMFYSIYHSSKIVITVINGACIGGGIGFPAVSDFTLASSPSNFMFSEVKLGLIPAVILPYVLNKIGNVKSKQLMLTGEKFSLETAKEIGLIDILTTPSDLQNSTKKLIEKLRSGEMLSQQKIKSFINGLLPCKIDEEMIDLTSGILASIRISEKSQYKIQEFLSHRNQESI